MVMLDIRSPLRLVAFGRGAASAAPNLSVIRKKKPALAGESAPPTEVGSQFLMRLVSSAPALG
jgi:hypothetical protein